MNLTKYKFAVSIIIPNYNTRDLLIECINSLYKYHNEINFEIIVVDDCSTDGSVESIASKFVDVKIISNNSNKGYCFSNNRGIEAANGEYIVLMNSDVIFIEPVFPKMISFMNSHNDSGFAAIKLVNEDWSLQYSCRKFPSISFGVLFSLLPKIIIKHLKVYNDYYTLEMDYNKTQVVDMAAATCCIIRRDVIKRIGLMDERYFMYVGDSEWFYRSNKAGFLFYYLNTPKIIHLGSQSTKLTNNKFLLKEYSKGFEIFYKDHLMDNFNVIIGYSILLGLKVRHILISLRASITNSYKIGNVDIK